MTAPGTAGRRWESLIGVFQGRRVHGGITTWVLLQPQTITQQPPRLFSPPQGPVTTPPRATPTRCTQKTCPQSLPWTTTEVPSPQPIPRGSPWAHWVTVGPGTPLTWLLPRSAAVVRHAQHPPRRCHVLLAPRRLLPQHPGYPLRAELCPWVPAGGAQRRAVPAQPPLVRDGVLPT